MITLSIVAISLTVGLVLLSMQVYGQEVNNSIVGKSMVDKLIEETKGDIAREEAYRQEIIKRIENSTCISSKFINLSSISTPELESRLKLCVLQGTIK
jgi:hypothetical protein